MKTILALAVLTATLAGCNSAPRTPDYECPLGYDAGAKDIPPPKCASVDQAYQATRSMDRTNAPQVQSVFDRRVQANGSAAPAKPFFQGQTSGYPEPGQIGMPVFQQPKVMRAWVAPYVDATGNLRSGEYTYFSTPGQWNYGDTRKPGAASGIFEPSKPSNLGFTPVTSPSAAGRQAPVAAAPARPPEPAGASAAAPRAATSTDSITQPYQRLPSN
jgi:type IV conjugative transfer system lipoprotein TraV